jgi:hypothetical protein
VNFNQIKKPNLGLIDLIQDQCRKGEMQYPQ